jgi:SAM-dependent methyltransferase
LLGTRWSARIDDGAIAHYADPSYYQKTYARRGHDVRFYCELARRLGGPVLEYGCGNGRVTLALARAGHEVVGLDASGPMLDDLRRRLRAESAGVRALVRLVHADMRTARVRGRFPLVLCPFNTFLHLYGRADVERFLGRVRAHLAARGRFVFDVSMPSPVELARDPTRAYRTAPIRWPTTGELVRYAELFDYDPVTQILRVTLKFEPVAAPSRAWATLLAHRQYHPREIEALLHYNGFEVESVLADFEPALLHRYADSAVWTVRRVRTRARPER